jgi:hypothetical protein
MQPRASGDMTEFWYGTETRTRSVPYSSAMSSDGAAGAPATNLPPGSSAAPLVVPGAAGAAVTEPATGATGATGSAAGVMGSAAVATGAVAAASQKAAASPQGLASTAVPATVPSNNGPPDAAAGSGTANSALTLDGPSQVKVGDEFQVTVRLSTDQSITRLRSQLRFDSTAVQLTSAVTGDMVPAAANNPKIEVHGGGASLDLTTTSDSPVQGSGSMMVLQFKALAARPATQMMAMLNVLGGTGAAAASASAPPLKIAIQP